MSKAKNFIDVSENNRVYSASSSKHAEGEISKALHRGLQMGSTVRALPGQGFPLVYLINVEGNPQQMRVTIEPNMQPRRPY